VTVPRNRAGSSKVLLEPLIAMQYVPEQGEEKRANEPGDGCKNNERGGSCQIEWPDHKNRLNKVHPEHKIDQRLRPAKSNQNGPANMVAAEQRAKGDTSLEWIDHL